MCMKIDKKKNAVTLEICKSIYPKEVIDSAVEKGSESFNIKVKQKKEKCLVSLEGGKKTDLELLGYEFANYLLYFSKTA